MRLDGDLLQTMSLEARTEQERFEIISDFMLCHIMVCTAREGERIGTWCSAAQTLRRRLTFDQVSSAARVAPSAESHAV